MRLFFLRDCSPVALGAGWGGCQVWAVGRPRVGAGFASYIGNFQAAGWKNILVLSPPSGLSCCRQEGALAGPKGSLGLAGLCRPSWNSASEPWMFARVEKPRQGPGVADPGGVWLCCGNGVWALLLAAATVNPCWSLGVLGQCFCSVPCPAATSGRCLGAVGPSGRRGTP